MKCHVQCAEQHWLPCNITKHCACHEILTSKCQRKIIKLLPPRQRPFEHDPNIKSSSRTRRFGDLTRPILETHFVWKNTGYLSKFHEMLRLPQKVTFHLHQILRLPRRMNLMSDPYQTWRVTHLSNVIYNAHSNKNHPPTAPNTAPAALIQVAPLFSTHLFHSAVARSTFASQNVKNMTCWRNFFEVQMSKNCRKMARRCGTKRICKSKC